MTLVVPVSSQPPSSLKVFGCLSLGFAGLCTAWHPAQVSEITSVLLSLADSDNSMLGAAGWS